jgi:hypothetical protein
MPAALELCRLSKDLDTVRRGWCDGAVHRKDCRAKREPEMQAAPDLGLFVSADSPFSVSAMPYAFGIE